MNEEMVEDLGNALDTLRSLNCIGQFRQMKESALCLFPVFLLSARSQTFKNRHKLSVIQVSKRTMKKLGSLSPHLDFLAKESYKGFRLSSDCNSLQIRLFALLSGSIYKFYGERHIKPKQMSKKAWKKKTGTQKSEHMARLFSEGRDRHATEAQIMVIRGFFALLAHFVWPNPEHDQEFVVCCILLLHGLDVKPKEAHAQEKVVFCRIVKKSDCIFTTWASLIESFGRTRFIQERLRQIISNNPNLEALSATVFGSNSHNNKSYYDFHTTFNAKIPGFWKVFDNGTLLDLIVLIKASVIADKDKVPWYEPDATQINEDAIWILQCLKRNYELNEDQSLLSCISEGQKSHEGLLMGLHHEMSRLKNLLPPQPPEEEIGTENRMKSAPQNFDFNNWEFRDNGQRVNTHRKKTSGLQNTAQNLGSRTEPFPTNSPVSHGPLVSEFEFNGLLDVVEDKCRREDCPFPQPNIPVYNLPSEIVQAQPQTSPIWPPMSLPPPPPIPPQFSASLPGKSPQSSPPQNISIPTEDQIFKTPKSLQKRQSDQSEDYKDRIEAVGRENLSEKKEAQKELAKTPTTEGCKLEKDGIIDLCDSDDEFESGQVKASVPSQSSKAVSIPCVIAKGRLRMDETKLPASGISASSPPRKFQRPLRMDIHSSFEARQDLGSRAKIGQQNADFRNLLAPNSRVLRMDGAKPPQELDSEPAQEDYLSREKSFKRPANREAELNCPKKRRHKEIPREKESQNKKPLFELDKSNKEAREPDLSEDLDLVSMLDLFPTSLQNEIQQFFIGTKSSSRDFSQRNVDAILLDQDQPVVLSFSNGEEKALDFRADIPRILQSINTAINTSSTEKEKPRDDSELFTGSNCVGIPATLHMISALRNREDSIVGLTCQIGRHIPGASEILQDVLGKIVKEKTSVLIIGPAGSGKTNLMRDLTNSLLQRWKLRSKVMVIDTKCEIGGLADVPHHAVRKARRIQASQTQGQDRQIHEAAHLHKCEVLVVDEISNDKEMRALGKAKEKGTTLLVGAQLNSLDDLKTNPTFCVALNHWHGPDGPKSGSVPSGSEQNKNEALFGIIIILSKVGQGITVHRNRGKIESLQNPVPAPTLPNSNTAQPSLIENCGELPSQNFKDQPQDKKESGQGANSDVGPKSLFPTLFPSSLSPPMPWSVPWAQFPVMGVPSSYIQGLQPNSSQIPPEPPRDFRVPLPQPPSGSPPNFPRKSPSPDSDIPSNGLEDHRKFPDRRRRSPKQKIRDNGDAFGGIKSKIREEDAFGGVKPGNRNFPRRMHTSVSPELADLTSLLPKIQMGRRWDK